MKFEILIATVDERAAMLKELRARFVYQIADLNLPTNEIGIRILSDNKEMSVGKHRQLLLEQSRAEWIVYFDDDDLPYSNYVSEIYKSITEDIDCIGFPIDMTTNGAKPQKCCHSLRYPEWRTKFDGWDYVRNITHFNPVKRELALKSGFKDMRFGEDKDYSDRLYPLLKKEYYISTPLFLYRYSTMQSHNEKYGFK